MDNFGSKLGINHYSVLKLSLTTFSVRKQVVSTRRTLQYIFLKRMVRISPARIPLKIFNRTWYKI